MSQIPHEPIIAAEAGIDDHLLNHPYPPQSAPTQASPGVPDFVDGSGPIFSMYLEMAEEEDKKMTEGWKADADGILIFTGLFSAAVASFISVSIQDIRPNPQDTSNFYLANFYQASIADPNRSNISIPSSPPTFSPPNYAVWVNSLWFMSLVISPTCAMLATLLQQWARRYLKVTQPRYSPHKRARIRAFFLEGVDKFLLPWVVEALPTLLHVSLFLFFAGLVVFLCNVNLTIFKLVLSWVGLCAALYGCITFLPIIFRDCPYYTPLSLPAWNIGVGILFFTLQAFLRLTDSFFGEYSAFRQSCYRVRKLLVQGMQKTVEEIALKSPPDIVTRTFLWTFESLDEDHELERFFSGLPGFRNSKVVNDPLPSLTEKQKEKIFETFKGFLDRTFSSDLLTEPVKNRRAIICLKAMATAEFPDACQWLMDKIMKGNKYRGLRTAEFGRILRGWVDGPSRNQGSTLVVQAILLTGIVANTQRRNDSWLIFASGELGVPEPVLRDYAAHGDSLSLAILIHVTRQQLIHFRDRSWPQIKFLNVLEAASKFEIRDTLPELQHEFCALWNQIVLNLQIPFNEEIADFILGPIRNIYIALHQDTDSGSTRLFASTRCWDYITGEPCKALYPVCNFTGHVHADSTSTAVPCNVPHDNAALPPTSLSSPDASSSSVPAPHHVDESLTNVLPLDNITYVPGSFHQASTENPQIPATSQYSITAQVLQDSSTAVTLLSTRESTPPTTMALAPPAAVAIQHIATHRMLSDALDVLLLPPPTPVLNDMLPTAPQSSSNTPVTRSNIQGSRVGLEKEEGGESIAAEVDVPV